MDALTDPFAAGYMQRAWLELALLAVPAGALGVFVVLRRMAFAVHAVGAATFPGAVLAVAAGASVFAGSLLSALVFAALLAVLLRRPELDAPAATGLVLAGALALGSLLVSGVVDVGSRANSLLVGSLLGVDEGDLARSAAVAALALALVAALGRGWLVVAFDREGAPTLGARPAALDLALAGVVALAVVASVAAVGGLLVSSLFVVPAATARLFTRRLPGSLALAAALALVLATVGLWLAHRLSAPPGATVAAVAAAGFAVAVALRELATRRRAAAVALALVALGAGCGGADGDGDGDGAGGRLEVVASTPIVADWARQLGGRHVEVRALLGADVDPHDYEPSTDDADAIAGAGLLLASGAGLDGWIDDLATNADGADLVAVAPEARLRPPALAEHDDGEVDPHFWHDPVLAAAAVRRVQAALAAADPGHRAAYRASADRYLARLRSLDADLRRRFAAVPAARRRMVTNHDAFGYLARRYDIEVIGAVIPSTAEAAEPSARETAQLIDLIRREHVRAVFAEATASPKLARQLARDAGARVEPGLYGDALGPPGSGADTYLRMMRHNADVLLRGLS